MGSNRVTVGSQLPAGTNNIGDVDVLTLPALPAGTNAIGKLAANSGVDIGDVDVLTLPGVAGNVAHDAADSGNPVKIGGVAIDIEALPADVAPGDRVQAAYTPKGFAAVALFNPVSSTPLETIPVNVTSAPDIVLAAGSANIGDVDVASSALPTGAATEATLADVQSDTFDLGTKTGAINETAPGTDTANSGLNGRLQRIAQNITTLIAKFTVGAGTEAAALRVTLPTDGTGKVGLNAGTNNIGDVDVLTLPALVAGTANIGDVDVLTLPALPAGNNNIGDVDVASLPAAATGYVGDAAATATPTGIMEMGLAKAAAPTDVSADNDAVAAWRLRNGATATVITAAGALVGGDAANGLDVDVTRLPALVAGSANIGDVDVASIAAGDNNIGNVDVVTLPALVAGSANIGDVDVLTLPNVTLAAGTNTNEVVGDVAEDIALAGNPVRQGVRASTAVPTAMSADNDIVTPWANRNGAQVVVTAPHVGLNSDPWNLVHEGAQYTTAQTSTVLVTGGASEKIVVTKVQIQCGGTVAGTVILYFGTGAYSRGTSRAIFDGEFAPSATSKPGVVMDGPFIAGTNGDDLMVTTTNSQNPLTFSIWYYVVV